MVCMDVWMYKFEVCGWVGVDVWMVFFFCFFNPVYCKYILVHPIET